MHCYIKKVLNFFLNHTLVSGTYQKYVLKRELLMCMESCFFVCFILLKFTKLCSDILGHSLEQ